MYVCTHMYISNKSLSIPKYYTIALLITRFLLHFQALVPPVALLPGFLLWSQFLGTKCPNLPYNNSSSNKNNTTCLRNKNTTSLSSNNMLLSNNNNNYNYKHLLHARQFSNCSHILIYLICAPRPLFASLPSRIID